MVQINISDEVWKELQKNAIPLVDTADSIIRKLLRMDDNKNLEPAQDLSGQKQDINTKEQPINNVHIPLSDSEIISLLEGKRLRKITQKGIEHRAEVKNGMFVVENKPFKPFYSPSPAAIYAAGGGSINGWKYWKYFDFMKNNWFEIDNLRHYSRLQIQKALENKQ